MAVPTVMTCALCQGPGPLVEGHLFSRFYWKRMRREGGGLIRRPVDPNVSHQDGPKEYFLCEGCEGAFNTRETIFARDFFHPWMNERSHPDKSTADTHYFLVSLLWRGLRAYMPSPGKEARPWIARLATVQEDWRQYLNGEKAAPECDQVHMMQLDVLVPGPQPVRNLNRYMVSSCDATVGASSTRCLVYVKMGMFLTIGWVAGFVADQWENTRIQACTAPFLTPFKVRDPELGAFMTHRARGSHELYQAGISEKQQDKVAARAAKEAEQLVTGIIGRAYQADLDAVINPTLGRATKIRRNEKCPCGSGKKYKYCHGKSSGETI